jgi:hypothetical protein
VLLRGAGFPLAPYPLGVPPCVTTTFRFVVLVVRCRGVRRCCCCIERIQRRALHRPGRRSGDRPATSLPLPRRWPPVLLGSCRIASMWSMGWRWLRLVPVWHGGRSRPGGGADWVCRSHDEGAGEPHDEDDEDGDDECSFDRHWFHLQREPLPGAWRLSQRERDATTDAPLIASLTPISFASSMSGLVHRVELGTRRGRLW